MQYAPTMTLPRLQPYRGELAGEVPPPADHQGLVELDGVVGRAQQVQHGCRAAEPPNLGGAVEQEVIEVIPGRPMQDHGRRHAAEPLEVRRAERTVDPNASLAA